METDRPLSDLTSMRTGGVARYFCSPESPAQLGAVMERCRESGIETRFIGGATNIIVVSGVVDAMVIRIHTPTMAYLEFEGDRVVAGAGLRMERLVSEAGRRGLAGLEFMIGVPGTVGGAVASGAGTRGGNFLDAVAEIETVGAGGRAEWAGGTEVSEGQAVTRCAMRLAADDPAEIRKRMEAEKRYRRETQPYGVFSAGCIFRNPPGDHAGRLIDKAGLKGVRIGNAEVSTAHANYIVNTGATDGADVLKLIKLVKEKVSESCGVSLELEVEIW